MPQFGYGFGPHLSKIGWHQFLFWRFSWPGRQANQPQSIKEKRPKVFLEASIGEDEDGSKGQGMWIQAN